MIKEGRYIIRRIIIGVAIALILGFINSCEVKAETYNINTNELLFYTSGGGTLSGSVDTLYTNSNVQSYYAFRQRVILSNSLDVIFPGQYLIEFYVYSNSATLTSRENCSILASNFENINMTTGNWVANEISSQCIDIYATQYNGKNAYRILYKFNYTGARTGADGITELRFLINSSPNDFFYGNSYALASSNIYDYDISIINQFQSFKQNQTIINGQQGIINATTSSSQNIINNQNTNTQTIINNNNSNTNSIISNQDSNTDDIINNQNSNTDKEIESQKSCTTIDKNNNIKTGYRLNENADEQRFNDTYGITDYIKITSSTIEVLVGRNATSSYYCFYNTNKTKISCNTLSSLQVGQNITIPDNATYFRSSLNIQDNQPTYKICTNGNQAITNSIEDMNSSIKDDTVDDPDEYFDEFEDLMADNGVITDLITLPISLYTKILNNINGTCSPFNLGQLLGTDLQFGCINIGNLIGSTLWNIIDIIVSGMFVLIIAKRMIKVFENMTSMKESDDLE